MKAAGVRTIGHGAARAEGKVPAPGGAIAALVLMSAMRFTLLAWVGPAWWLAADLLMGALLLPWVYRNRAVAIGMVLTTPAWLALGGAVQGMTLWELGPAMLVGSLWHAGLGLWGVTADTPVDRSRRSTTWTTYLLTTLVVSYFVGWPPMIFPTSVSPMLVGFNTELKIVVFGVFLGCFPFAAWLGRLALRHLSTPLPG